MRCASLRKQQQPQRAAQQHRAQAPALRRQAEAKVDGAEGKQQEHMISAAALLNDNHALRGALNKADEDARQLRARCAMLRQKMHSVN